MRSSPMTQTPLANRFADYAGRLRFEDLPGRHGA